MPDAGRTRSLAYEVESTRVSHYRSAETVRHSLRDGFTAYTRSPRSAGLDSLRRPYGVSGPKGRHRHPTDLIPASGDQDHTILPSAPTPFVRRPGASTAFHPNVRDGRETPLDSRVEQNGNIKAMRRGVKYSSDSFRRRRRRVNVG